MITDHPYRPGGAFGRCAAEGCGKRKSSHGVMPGGNWDAPPASLMVPLVPPPLPPWPSTEVDTTILESDLAVSTIPVTIRQKRGMSCDIDWPGIWPLPANGQIVRIEGQAMTVRTIEFELDSNRIIVHCA